MEKMFRKLGCHIINKRRNLIILISFFILLLGCNGKNDVPEDFLLTNINLNGSIYLLRVNKNGWYYKKEINKEFSLMTSKNDTLFNYLKNFKFKEHVATEDSMWELSIVFEDDVQTMKINGKGLEPIIKIQPEEEKNKPSPQIWTGLNFNYLKLPSDSTVQLRFNEGFYLLTELLQQSTYVQKEERFSSVIKDIEGETIEIMCSVLSRTGNSDKEVEKILLSVEESKLYIIKIDNTADEYKISGDVRTIIQNTHAIIRSRKWLKNKGSSFSMTAENN